MNRQYAYQRLLRTLEKVAKHRTSGDLGWIERERAVMLRETNRLRAEARADEHAERCPR